MPDKSVSLSDIQDVLNRVNFNRSGIFSRNPEPITIISPEISEIIGDNLTHISEFIIAKIKGYIPELNSHSEITDDIFKKIPLTLSSPRIIYKDKRIPTKNKYLFISRDSSHLIVIETKREESGVTEINSIIPIGRYTLKQLGNKFQAVFSS